MNSYWSVHDYKLNWRSEKWQKSTVVTDTFFRIPARGMGVKDRFTSKTPFTAGLSSFYFFPLLRPFFLLPAF